MPGEAEIGRSRAETCVEIVDRIGAVVGVDLAVTGKAERLQSAFKNVERAFVFRRHARPANQIARQRQRVRQPCQFGRGRGIAQSRSNSLMDVLARVWASTRLTMTAQ